MSTPLPNGSLPPLPNASLPPLFLPTQLNDHPAVGKAHPAKGNLLQQNWKGNISQQMI